MNSIEMRRGLSLYEQSVLNTIQEMCPNSIVNNVQRRELAVKLAARFHKRMEALKSFYDRRQKT